MEEAVAAAAEAFRTWSELSASNRSRTLAKYVRLLLDHQPEVAKSITVEQGKVPVPSGGAWRWEGEVAELIHTLGDQPAGFFGRRWLDPPPKESLR